MITKRIFLTRWLSLARLAGIVLLVFCWLLITNQTALAADPVVDRQPEAGTSSGSGDPEAPQGCFTLSLTSSPSYAGNVLTYPPPNCDYGRSFLSGTEVRITASPNPGYAFSYWTGSAGGYANPTVVVMNANKAVTAVFTSVCYTLSRGVTPTGAGNINFYPGPNCPNGTQYLPGTTVQLTATPNFGYTFSYWSGDKSGSSNPTSIVMNGHKTVVANFVYQCYSLSLSINPGSGGGINRSLAPNCNGGTQYLPGSEVWLTAVPASGYSFTSWSGDVSGTGNPVKVVMNKNRSVTATFMLVCYSLYRNVSPAGSGSINVSPGPNCNNQTQYYPGTPVQLTANPATGYSFSYWSGDVSGVNNSVQVTMSGNRSVTANFALQCFSLSLASSPPGTGSVSASPAPNCNAGTQYGYGTQVTVTANPAAGFLFTNWSGDVSGSTNPLQLTMTAARTIFANFERPTPVLGWISPSTVLAGGGDFTLSVGGSGFTSVSLIQWNGTNLTTSWVNSQLVEATIPAASIVAPGSAWVTVYTPAPGGGTSGALLLTIGTSNPGPVLMSFDPAGLAPSGQDSLLKVLGRNFAPGAKFYWDGNLLTTVFIKSTELWVTVPGGYLTVPGFASVYAENIAPGGGVSTALQLPIYHQLFLPLVSK